MRDRIDKELARTGFASQEELRGYVSSTQAMIQEYERQLYETSSYSGAERDRLKEWRHRLYQIVRANKDVPEKEGDGDELESTVRIVHRQVRKADANQQLLDRGTLKLMGLSYTSSDIEKALSDARRRVLDGRRKERSEAMLVLLALLTFVCVCAVILFDKFVSWR